jgi:hypothetical protein
MNDACSSRSDAISGNYFRVLSFIPAQGRSHRCLTAFAKLVCHRCCAARNLRKAG